MGLPLTKFRSTPSAGKFAAKPHAVKLGINTVVPSSVGDAVMSRRGMRSSRRARQPNLKLLCGWRKNYFAAGFVFPRQPSAMNNSVSSMNRPVASGFFTRSNVTLWSPMRCATCETHEYV